MAEKPRARDCAAFAMDLLNGERIPYVLGGEHLDHRGSDCQGLIESVVRKLGGQMSYRGSNDMFRNACSYIGTLKQAKNDGRLVPGAVLFIVRKDGKQPAHYKDSLGNASHVGWYTGGKAEVVHASSSKGAVVPSTLKNAWTHVGWLKAVDYEKLKEVEQLNKGLLLTLGDRGELVKNLQSKLLSFGYDVGNRTGADGILGPATHRAIQKFQVDHGLEATGNWDNAAEKVLQSMSNQAAPGLQSPGLSERIRMLAQEMMSIAEQLEV